MNQLDNIVTNFWFAGNAQQVYFTISFDHFIQIMVLNVAQLSKRTTISKQILLFHITSPSAGNHLDSHAHMSLLEGYTTCFELS